MENMRRKRDKYTETTVTHLLVISLNSDDNAPRWVEESQQNHHSELYGSNVPHCGSTKSLVEEYVRVMGQIQLSGSGSKVVTLHMFLPWAARHVQPSRYQREHREKFRVVQAEKTTSCMETYVMFEIYLFRPVTTIRKVMNLFI